MSRLSARNHDFMTHTSRYSRICLGSQSSHALHRKPSISKPALLPTSTNPFHFQSSSTHYNTKEGKFFSPFTGTIPIPRNTFQLSVPAQSKIIESNFTPMKITSSISEAKLIEDMQNMIPTAVREKKDMKLCLRTSIRQMKTLKINPDDLVIVGGFIPQMPYCRANSRIFFKHCKRGDRLEVEVMLEQDKYLAQVFDPMKMTGLHWAALRGYAEIANLLLKNTAFVDAVDCCHRTALHIAARNGYTDVIEILLKFNADSMIMTDGKKIPLVMAKNEQSKELIWRNMKVFCIQERYSKGIPK